MTAFTSPVDVANRGLGRCGLGGSNRITTFADDSKEANETGFVYDKLREAELRRNVWRFAIRKVALRAVADDTKIVVFPAWDVMTDYDPNAVVSYNNENWYLAHEAGSIGQAPSTTSPYWVLYFGPRTATLWDDGEAYYAGELVYDTTMPTPLVFLSLVNGNDDDPNGVGVTSWRLLDLATLDDLNFIYPVGSGPSNQSATRNVFFLPNGFLREAPQDPKAGSTSFLGAPSGRMYDDWTFENDLFTSRETLPIVFRFVANVSDVRLMDPMFCEGLACRIALEVCETLTQSGEKLQSIGAAYNRFMSEARVVNGIETGPVEPPEDDYITCRI